MGKHYVCSDIHGCFDAYKEALEKIRFCDDDTLYVIGDVMDRGPSPIKTMQDMMQRKNIVNLWGNHDYLAFYIFRELYEAMNRGKDIYTKEFVEIFENWKSDGGDTTLLEFTALLPRQQADILKYMSQFKFYVELEVNKTKYLMVHGGLEPFDEKRKIEDYDREKMLLSAPNYENVYFLDSYTITGHTPTVTSKGNKGTIIHKNNHIAIDCGCVYGYNLAVLCLETGEEFYIKGKKE